MTTAIKRGLFRKVQVIRWVGLVPVVAICTVCNQFFDVPPEVRKGTQARRNLTIQFSQHECEPTEKAASACNQ